MLLFMQLLKLQRPASLLKQAYQHLSVLTYLASSILCKIISFFPLLEKKKKKLHPIVIVIAIAILLAIIMMPYYQ